MTDLSTLIAMRLAHDLAGPLGAVTTGIDLLDGGDVEIRSLIADGAAMAVASLRLHRFILVPSSDGGAPHALLSAWIAQRDDVNLDWRSPPEHPRIVLGLAMTAAEAARRGGTLTVDGDEVTFTPASILDPGVAAALTGATVETARAALAGVLHVEAERCGGRIAVGGDASTLRLGYHGSALPR